MQNTKESTQTDEIRQIKRFLLHIDFKNMPVCVLNDMARLVHKRLANPRMQLDAAYSELAGGSVNNDAFRGRLGYYIDKNFEATQKNIEKKYAYSIGNYFDGVKNFIDQLAIVYSVFSAEI